MAAKYYIYRNLHTGTFSVRYKGKVIAHPTNIIAKNASFKVSAKGRARVLRERKKYVHAFVVCEDYVDLKDLKHILCNVGTRRSCWHEVIYNPYQYEQFTNSLSLTPQRPQAKVILKAGKVYTMNH